MNGYSITNEKVVTIFLDGKPAHVFDMAFFSSSLNDDQVFEAYEAAREVIDVGEAGNMLEAIARITLEAFTDEA